MIELLLLATLVCIGGVIIKWRLDEKRTEDFITMLLEADKEEAIPFDEDELWYDSYDICELCDDALYEDEARVAFPDGYCICEYCLNPALKEV